MLRHVPWLTSFSMHVEDLRLVFVGTGRNKTDLQKLLGKLREGGLVSMYGFP